MLEYQRFIGCNGKRKNFIGPKIGKTWNSIQAPDSDQGIVHHPFYAGRDFCPCRNARMDRSLDFSCLLPHLRHSVAFLDEKALARSSERTYVEKERR